MQMTSEIATRLGPEMLGRMRDTLSTMFGGARQLDMWMTYAAEELAHPTPPTPQMMKMAPVVLQQWVASPHEAIDGVLETTELLGMWEYQIVFGGGGTLQVKELTCGHIVEELPTSDDNLQALAKKYGVKSGSQA